MIVCHGTICGAQIVVGKIKNERKPLVKIITVL